MEMHRRRLFGLLGLGAVATQLPLPASKAVAVANPVAMAAIVGTVDTYVSDFGAVTFCQRAGDAQAIYNEWRTETLSFDA